LGIVIRVTQYTLRVKVLVSAVLAPIFIKNILVDCNEIAARVFKSPRLPFPVCPYLRAAQ